MKKAENEMKISEENAFNELKTFIHKWVKRPCNDEELVEKYQDIHEAIMEGYLIIDEKTQEPKLKLRTPIMVGTEFERSEITFKTRITPNTKGQLACNINLEKQGPIFSLILIAHICGFANRKELDLLDKYDYELIAQISLLFQ